MKFLEKFKTALSFLEFKINQNFLVSLSVWQPCFIKKNIDGNKKKLFIC